MRLVDLDPASSSGSFTPASAPFGRRRSWRAHAPPGLPPERRRPRERSRYRHRGPPPRLAAMAVHGIRPSRNAATATSLAPLSTAGAPPPARPASNARREARERVEIGGLEGELRHLRPVDGAERLGETVRRAEGETDREAHVGHRELGDGGAVDELHHAVHDRLRVHHDVDLVEGDAEQLVGLDHLEALVHERRRVDGDLGAHVPGGVAQRVGDGDLLELLAGEAPERTAAGGEDQPLHLGRHDRIGGTGRGRSARCRRGRSRRSPGRGPRPRPGRPRSGSPCWPGRDACRAPARRAWRAGRRSRRPR